MQGNIPHWLVMLKRGADAVGVLLFLAAFTGFIVQVFFRYVLNSPIAWTEEAVMIAFIWAVFWSAAFMVPIKGHVTFDVVYDVVSDNTRRIFAICCMLALIAAFGMLIPHTWDYLEFLQRRRSPVLRVQMHWVYGCYILFLVAFTIQALYRLWGLLRPGWREHI
ncbi:TRAP transporter small permease [Arsenicitalea aurantiaca]|uniref:TRAP transporter small permease protein n=1 Tax=Arsenicitalea aurantiaca TaxID=1783274 RepID=A0A433X2Q0_9HYPH|nr:TRAP transporter small permease [Arsenicitalea aurantiaca]RUT28341.1 TRAP transporter small permease [Arsenicitalea aurantiaca]